MAVSGDSVEAELRVGMLDMALAKLLSNQHHTIEFPTLLLPENVEPGSIVRLTCTRAAEAELEDAAQFEAVQTRILESFATHLPKKPVLRIHNVTQTSVVLEWDPLDIASADLRFLALYKDSQRLGLIPNALKRTSMKVSNLEIDMPYTFRLVLSTSAGDFESDALEVQTRKMSDLSGVVVCVGSLSHSAISQAEIEATLQRLGCKPAQSTIKLDTTHFLCTTEGGSQYDRAVELSIPVVRPEWLKACEAERKLVSVRGYYLSANPQLVPPPRERSVASPTPPPVEQPAQPEQPGTQQSEEQSEEQSDGQAQHKPEEAVTGEDKAGASRSKNHHVRFDVPDSSDQRDSMEALSSATPESQEPHSNEQPESEVPQAQPEHDSASEHPDSQQYSALPSVVEPESEPPAESSAQPDGEETLAGVSAVDTTADSIATPEDTVEDSPRPVSESTPEPAEEAAASEPGAPGAEDLNSEPVQEPTSESGTDPTTQEATEEAAEKQTASEPATVSSTGSATESTTEPATVSTTGPATELATEPATVSTTDPATESTTDPATEVNTETAAEQTESTGEPAAGSDVLTGGTLAEGVTSEPDANPDSGEPTAETTTAPDAVGEHPNEEEKSSSSKDGTPEPAGTAEPAGSGRSSSSKKKNKKKKSNKK